MIKLVTQLTIPAREIQGGRGHRRHGVWWGGWGQSRWSGAPRWSRATGARTRWSLGWKHIKLLFGNLKNKIVSPYEVAKSPHSSANQQKSDRFRQRSGKAWSMNQSFWYNWWSRWYWIGMIYCGGVNPEILNKHCQRHNGPMGWDHNWRHLIASKFNKYKQVVPHAFVWNSATRWRYLY